MCHAIKNFFLATGRLVGFKAADGLNTVQGMLDYRGLTEIILGSKWLRSHLFHTGASSLSENILSVCSAKRHAPFSVTIPLCMFGYFFLYSQFLFGESDYIH